MNALVSLRASSFWVWSIAERSSNISLGVPGAGYESVADTQSSCCRDLSRARVRSLRVRRSLHFSVSVDLTARLRQRRQSPVPDWQDQGATSWRSLSDVRSRRPSLAGLSLHHRHHVGLEDGLDAHVRIDPDARHSDPRGEELPLRLKRLVPPVHADKVVIDLHDIAK